VCACVCVCARARVCVCVYVRVRLCSCSRECLVRAYASEVRRCTNAAPQFIALFHAVHAT